MRLLLVEDEIRMAQALCELFRLEGYETDHYSDGMEGLEALKTNIYDIVILDVMLPKLNGFEIVKTARNCGIRSPILMLTAKSEIDDIVSGLDSGADDYLTKPFMSKELLARIRALTRRGKTQIDDPLEFGDVKLDPKTSSLICVNNSQTIRLGEKEYRILEYLITNKGQILTREQLALRIWGFDSDAEYNNVEVYMTFTRKKLNFVGSKTEIKAVRGIGYELRCGN